MKRVLVVFAVWALLCRMASAQGILPYVEGTFTANNGTPLALGKICTTTSGGSTNLPTYPTYADAVAGTNANANPVVLDAYGRANIWLPGGTAYRIRIIAAGVGGTACNGDSAVGVDIKIIDGVTTGVSVINALTINGVQMCDQYPGSTAGAKIAACVAALPVAGGVADAIGIQGAQTISSDPFGGSTKPVTLLLGAATFTVSDTIILPPSSQIIGLGKATKMVSASTSAPAAEMIRMNGDYTTLRNFWMYGSGQESGATVDGRRGVWIGDCADHNDVTCFSDYATVENMIIENFGGNGISGSYRYAKIINNDVHHNTDANIFAQAECVHNLYQGNTVYNSRYSGFDINGSYNRIIGNTIHTNGGGTGPDTYSHNGILVTYIPAAATLPNATRNIIDSNDIFANVGSGILIYNPGPTTAGQTNPPWGTMVTNNTVASHVTQASETAGQDFVSWMAGIAIIGGGDSIIQGNVSSGNTFNYLAVGTGSFASNGTIISNNKSLNAVTNAALTALSLPSGVGFFFPSSARLDGVGGYTVQDAVLSGNSDRYSALDSYQWYKGAAAAVNWTGWEIFGNLSDGAGTGASSAAYGFNIENPGTFLSNKFSNNTSINARTNMTNGFQAVGLTPNSTTPSVINGMFFLTANTSFTTVTNFTSGFLDQAITVAVGDAVTTFDFSSSDLIGNAGVDFTASIGDFLSCKYGHNGTDPKWYCDTNVQAVSGGYANGVGQSVTQGSGSGKATTVAPALSTLRTLITTDGAALNAATAVSFTFTNSYMTASSQAICTHHGGGTPGSYTVNIYPGAGTSTITLVNISGVNLSEAVVLDCRIYPTA